MLWKGAIGLILAPLFYYALNLFFSERSYTLERQDQPPLIGRYSWEEFSDLMNMLSTLNRLDPNGYNATLREFDKLPMYPSSILEIGFGQGMFSLLLAERYQNATVVGIDTHQMSVKKGNENLALMPHIKNARFEIRDRPELNEPRKSVDVITTTLVNHHIFPDEAFVDFLKRVANVGRLAFIFNDVHRSPKCLFFNDIQAFAAQYIPNIVLFPLSSMLSAAFLHGDDVAMRYNELFSNPNPQSSWWTKRPGMSLFAEGGRLSMRRAFTFEKYLSMFKEAGYPSDAIHCTRLDKSYSTIDSTCRMVCYADLQWS